MSFEITTSHEFSASHQLRLQDGSQEPLHGHNWRVSVTVSAEKLDKAGFLMDFHELERLVEVVIKPMHNGHLNSLEALAALNPTAENLALHVARSLRLPAGVQLRRVEVWETPVNSAVYMP